MQQKTMWMRFTTIGIILFFSPLFFICNSCTDRGGGGVHYAKYIYINNTSKNLIIKVYNTSQSTTISQDFPINIGDSITIDTDAAPFDSHGGYSIITGDSISIQFNDNKCLSYTRDNTGGVGYTRGTGLFNVLNYDDYRPGITYQDYFTLHYTFTENMYDMATPCD